MDAVAVLSALTTSPTLVVSSQDSKSRSLALLFFLAAVLITLSPFLAPGSPAEATSHLHTAGATPDPSPVTATVVATGAAKREGDRVEGKDAALCCS